MSWDQGRLSEHGEPLTAARGCRCDACRPVAERLHAMAADRAEGMTYKALTKEYGWHTRTIQKYLRILEGSPE